MRHIVSKEGDNMFMNIYRLFNLFMAGLTAAMLYMFIFNGVQPHKFMVILWGLTFILDAFIVIVSTYEMENKNK